MMTKGIAVRPAKSKHPKALFILAVCMVFHTGKQFNFLASASFIERIICNEDIYPVIRCQCLDSLSNYGRSQEQKKIKRNYFSLTY
jgi:hypothetical protein